MAVHSLGSVTVSSPGTPVRATVNETDAAERVPAQSLLFEALSGNVGAVYVGGPDLDRTTLAGVYAVLPPPSTNVYPSFSVTKPDAPGAFSANRFYVDADNADDGVLISIVR